MTDGPTTRIACSDADSVTIRGENLVDDLIGKKTFTEMVYFLTRGRHPSSTETAILDACLVTLMEHGFTPAALVRSEEHTSELQSLMRNSYAVFCFKKKKTEQT